MPGTEALEPASLDEVLALASSAAGGAAFGLTDLDQRLVAGSGAAVGVAEGPRRAMLTAAGSPLGVLHAGAAASEALVALVARTLELIVEGSLDHAEHARVTRELQIGREIQLALVPGRFPDTPGWTIAAAYEPAREVGGDLYDVFRVRGRSDQLGIVVADVTGKGIPAALLMADVRALLHAAADNAAGPADALGRVNRILVDERRTKLFVTAVLLILDPATGRVRFASAGHEAPLVARRDGALEPIEAVGTILGAFPDATFTEGVAELRAGDALVLYTDGVTEARNEQRAFFGDERLSAAIGRACGQPAASIVDTVVADVGRFRGSAEPFDDLTLLVVAKTARDA